MLQNLN